MHLPAPRLVLLVAVGGALGCLARHGVVTALGRAETVPVGTFTVNALGSLLLGVVVAAVASQQWRLAVGTGFLGGFTTYSALALETHDLATTTPRIAVAYAVATLAAGWILALVGLALGRRWGQR